MKHTDISGTSTNLHFGNKHEAKGTALPHLSPPDKNVIIGYLKCQQLQTLAPEISARLAQTPST